MCAFNASAASEDSQHPEPPTYLLTQCSGILLSGLCVSTVRLFNVSLSVSSDPECAVVSVCMRKAGDMQVTTAPYDHRFPSFNQARHCFTRYNEFYK